MTVVQKEVACKSLLLSYPNIFLNKEVWLCQLVPLWLPYFVEGKELLCILLLFLLPCSHAAQHGCSHIIESQKWWNEFPVERGKILSIQSKWAVCFLRGSWAYPWIKTSVNCFPEDVLIPSPKYVDSNHSFLLAMARASILAIICSPPYAVWKTQCHLIIISAQNWYSLSQLPSSGECRECSLHSYHPFYVPKCRKVIPAEADEFGCTLFYL